MGAVVNPVGESATKEFFGGPPIYAGGGASTADRGYFNVKRLAASGDYTLVNFRVPSDFISLLEAALLVYATATQAAANWDIYANYCQPSGEAYNVHSESDTSTTYNVTSGETFAVDISGILSSLSADDEIGVKILESSVGHDLDVIGGYIKYA